MNVQVDSGKSIQVQLLSFFLEDFASFNVEPGRPRPWLMDMPTRKLHPGLDMLYQKAAASTALAFFGIITVNADLREEARRTYAHTLEGHRRQILQMQRWKALQGTEQYADYMCNLVMVTLLLCSYELLLPSSMNSWFSHARGASVLLESLGPQVCRDGHLHQVLQSLRFGAVSIQGMHPRKEANPGQVLMSFTSGQSSFLADDEWVTIPFEGKSKTAVDELVDVLLRLPWSQMCSEAAVEDFVRDDMLRSAIDVLDEWWSRYRAQFDLDYTPSRDSLHYSSAHINVHRVGAVTVSLLNGVLVKLCSMMSDIRGLRDKHWQHSERTLSAAHYVFLQCNHHARMQVYAPVLMVTLHGASDEQKLRARGLLDRFEDHEGIGNISAIHKARQILSST